MKLLAITLRPIMFVGICVLLLTVPAAAQDDIPAPQFLYREGDRLILINGYTGETAELPIEVTEQDRFEWSPDGRYLLLRRTNDEDYTYCLNLYDVDTQAWLYDEPIACHVLSVKVSTDSSQIAYGTDDEYNSVLWLYSLAEETHEEFYRTTDGDAQRPADVSCIGWSPGEAFFAFTNSDRILGGSLNYLKIMNVDSRDYVSIDTPTAYYASYDLVWSPDGLWFLVILKDEYVTSGTMPVTNHEGDVYLVNAETGEKHRLTYTPYDYEYDLGWTDDGRITYKRMTTEQLTLEQAMQIEVVSPEDIATPEPIAPVMLSDSMVEVIPSQTPNIGAWVRFVTVEEGNRAYRLSIGDMSDMISYGEPFFTWLPKDYDYNNILIGWRPSDHYYPQG